MNVPNAAPSADPNAAPNGGTPPESVPVAPATPPAPEPSKPTAPAPAAPQPTAPATPAADPQLADRVRTLEFENNIARKVPHLAEHQDKLVEIQNKYPNMSFDEVVGHFLGSRIISGEGGGSTPTPPSTRTIAIPHGGAPKDPTQMTDAELEAAAKAELAALGLA